MTKLKYLVRCSTFPPSTSNPTRPTAPSHTPSNLTTNSITHVKQPKAHQVSWPVSLHQPEPASGTCVPPERDIGYRDVCLLSKGPDPPKYRHRSGYNTNGCLLFLCRSPPICRTAGRVTTWRSWWWPACWPTSWTTSLARTRTVASLKPGSAHTENFWRATLH